MCEKYIIVDMQSQSEPGPLELWIQEQIRANGPVTMAQFIEWALYHPTLGYYTTGPNIGPRGDFTTSPEASPGFGRLFARHLRDIDEVLGHPPQFDVIECGPGRGTLAHDLLGAVQEEDPDLYSRLRYWLVEISPALIEAQRERLLPEHSGLVQWRGSVEEIPHGAQAAVIANEFVDAFPVHVVENRDGIVYEQFVALDKNGALTIDYMPPSEKALLDFLQDQQINLQPGERIEINIAANHWLQALSDVLERGIVTIIDYGDQAPQRYSAARREGTLLAYYRGAVTDNILAHAGEQDITALVDFTALQSAAKQAGFTTVGITRQAHFLLGLGLGTTHTPETATSTVEEALVYRRGLQALISMEGLGRFHVLVLSKGIELQSATELPALKFVDL
ncbi:MAG: SAM-dependent methyltransferase [Chloroflexota bacterium]